MLAKKILTLVGLLVIAMAGGILADQVVWPAFVKRPLYVVENKEVKIEENTALTEAAERAGRAVVGVKTKTKAGLILQGSGLILTADGLVITTADLVPKAATFYFLVDNEWPAFQVLKTDLKQNLALVKVEKTNLPTVGFADIDKVRLGERLFLIGRAFEAPGQAQFFAPGSLVVDEGLVRSLVNGALQTNIFEKKTLQASPLFNIKGEALGLASIDMIDGQLGSDGRAVSGRVNIIPISKIRAFTGL